jgi:hypothetical protein
MESGLAQCFWHRLSKQVQRNRSDSTCYSEYVPYLSFHSLGYGSWFSAAVRTPSFRTGFETATKLSTLLEATIG